jgi:hypothetical protein
MVKNNLSLIYNIFSKDLTIYYILFSFILSLKVIFVFGAGPLPDEAYYWLWSKKPDYSYYDHPPLSTWLQGLLSGLISNKQMQIRIVPLISFFVILLINLHWVKLIEVDDHNMNNQVFLTKANNKPHRVKVQHQKQKSLLEII